MTLYHVTHANLLPWIRTRGLDPAEAQSGVRRVWLCTRALIPWAREHVIADHHGWALSSAVTIRVRIPRSHVIRWRRGIYWTGELIPARQLRPLLRR